MAQNKPLPSHHRPTLLPSPHSCHHHHPPITTLLPSPHSCYHHTPAFTTLLPSPHSCHYHSPAITIPPITTRIPCSFILPQNSPSDLKDSQDLVGQTRAMPTQSSASRSVPSTPTRLRTIIPSPEKWRTDRIVRIYGRPLSGTEPRKRLFVDKSLVDDKSLEDDRGPALYSSKNPFLL